MTTTVATPVKATKAVVGAVIAGVIAALGIVATDFANGADWSNVGTYLAILIAGLAGAGVTGAGVYNTTNAPKTNG